MKTTMANKTHRKCKDCDVSIEWVKRRTRCAKCWNEWKSKHPYFQKSILKSLFKDD